MTGKLDVNYWLPEYGQNALRIEDSPHSVVDLATLTIGRPGGVKDGPGGWLINTSEYVKSGVPVIRATNVVEDGLNLTDAVFITPTKNTELSATQIVPGDLLLTMRGTIGRSCVVPDGVPTANMNAAVCRIRLKDPAMAGFVRDFFNCGVGRRQALREAHKAVQGDLNLDAIEAFRIPLPEPAVRDNLVAELARARATRKKMESEADALLTGVDGFLIDTLGLRRPAEDERRVFAVRRDVILEDGRFDPGYHAPEFAQIQMMLAQIRCDALGAFVEFSAEKWKLEEHDEPTFRYIEISTVNPTTGEATWTAVPTTEAPSRARMKVREDDIIVSLTRPHHGSIAHLSAEFDGCIASTGFAVIREVSDRVRRDYLWSVLRAQFCLRQMFQRASGGNYPAITEEQLSKVVVPVPDPEVQETIAAEVQRRRAEARQLREEAKIGWEQARLLFEEQLLGRPTT